MSGQGRASSGVINATQLPPLGGSRGNTDKRHMGGMGMMDEEEMEEAMMEEDPYGEELEQMDED